MVTIKKFSPPSIRPTPPFLTVYDGEVQTRFTQRQRRFLLTDFEDLLTSIFGTRFLSSKIVAKIVGRAFQGSSGRRDRFIGIMKKEKYPPPIVSMFLDRALKSFQSLLSV